MKIISVGDLVRPGIYQLHSSFNKVLNFSSPDFLISLVSKDVGAGPSNVVTTDPLEEIQELKLNEPFDPSKIFDSTIPNLDVHSLRTKMESLFSFALSKAPPESLINLFTNDPSRTSLGRVQEAIFFRAHEGINLLKTGSVTDGANVLHGLGPGLTPSGDDFLAGFIIASHIRKGLDEELLESLSRALLAESQNFITKSFLYFAIKGRIFEPLKAFLQSNTPTSAKDALAALLSHGHSSGADFFAGLKTGI